MAKFADFPEAAPSHCRTSRYQALAGVNQKEFVEQAITKPFWPRHEIELKRMRDYLAFLIIKGSVMMVALITGLALFSAAVFVAHAYDAFQAH